MKSKGDQGLAAATKIRIKVQHSWVGYSDVVEAKMQDIACCNKNNVVDCFI